MSTIANDKFIATMTPSQRGGSQKYIREVAAVLQQLPFSVIDQVGQALFKTYQANKTVYLFGNGGSAALASHCACDFGKGTVRNGNRRFRVMALTDNVPLMTAWANDAHYDDIFAEQLRSFLHKEDLVFAISGSGNSPNVLKGLEFARDTGAMTVGLTGFQGGKMKTLCDLCIVVPSENMQVIEDVHLSVSHSIFVALRERFEDCGSHRSLAATVSSRSTS